MKIGVPDHPKFKSLVRRIRTSDIGAMMPEVIAMGILESLWQSTAKWCPQGNIGRFSNEEIADQIFWQADPDLIIKWLIESKWLDRDDDHRLLVHDWHEHAPTWVVGMLSRSEKPFFVPGGTKKVTKKGTKKPTKEATKDSAKDVSKDSTKETTKEGTAKTNTNTNTNIPPSPPGGSGGGGDDFFEHESAVMAMLAAAGLKSVDRQRDCARLPGMTQAVCARVLEGWRKSGKSPGAIIGMCQDASDAVCRAAKQQSHITTQAAAQQEQQHAIQQAAQSGQAEQIALLESASDEDIDAAHVAILPVASDSLQRRWCKDRPDWRSNQLYRAMLAKALSEIQHKKLTRKVK